MIKKLIPALILIFLGCTDIPDEICNPSDGSSDSSSNGSSNSSASVAPISSSSVVVSSSSSSISIDCTIDYYKTVKIGTQTWMAENLNCYVSGSICYDYKPIYGDTYGRLYNWATAMGLPSDCNISDCADLVQAKHQGVCPSGWHIPSDSDWDELMTTVGGDSTAAMHLKAKTGWDECGPSGSGNSYSCEDAYGFSALPGGSGSGPYFYNTMGWSGRWWSSVQNGGIDANYRYMFNNAEYSYRNKGEKSSWYSVRCIKDTE